MKKTTLIIFSVLLIMSTIGLTCFAYSSVVVETISPNTPTDFIIRDDPATTRTKTTTKKYDLPTIPQTTKAEVKTTKEAVTTSQPVVTVEDTTTKKVIYMNATFISEVPEDVSGDIDITIFNKDTGKTYDFVLPKNNNYFLITEIPVGEYIFKKVVIPNNEDDRFVAQCSSFRVGTVMNCLVNFTVVDTSITESQKTDENANEIKTDESSSIAPETTSSEIVVEPETKPENRFKTVIIPVAVLVPVIAIYIFKKYSKKDIENTETQNDIPNNNRY